ncbi:cyanophycinase [Exilibacterium tricleocarpae]|uniref:Cyanophycinase n=1 Tax=Exilibacterium tricleocarpae TaxID=2591008 RepID=A0A545TVD3_9GAMM|nr:cyanophycinase [Exilibacterium tricleocarpae]TQV81179.1 cyanophycinase [Exilibacterium tricleocarpae]
MIRFSLKQLPGFLTVVFVFFLSSLNALACISSESENNDRTSRADGPLCDGQPVQAALGSRRDSDWFWLDIDAGTALHITLDHSTADDFDWRLENEAGDVVFAAATAAVPETGTVAVAPGRYYLRVNSYSGSGWYDLTVQYSQTANCETGATPAIPADLVSWSVGSDIDACPALAGTPGLLLAGGGSDVDAAFSQRVKPHMKGGDVVVLRSTGSDGYNTYLRNLLHANSVTTLRVDSRAKANSDYVDFKIRHAEFVFFAGGDQSDYLNLWDNTKLETAVATVYARGGVVGGTSAGAAVLGEYIYDPDNTPGIRSAEAVTDFCHSYLNFSTGFLDIPLMRGIVNDTHFYERDRLGRLLVFMASHRPGTTGIGIDEGTALFVSAGGQASVDGSGYVYVIREDSQSQRLQTTCRQPVLYRDLLRYRLGAGDTFNLITGNTAVAPVRVSVDGRLSNFYAPSNPY